MKHLIIGTAGHVDHGKSALIKALTGTDTDRLKEEKQRGISIDLGFAALSLGKDIQAGIVDVPGHERFLKNMLAGTGGIDMAMLVIAADEGVMPQTREHLAMLNLYGIKNGIVVINKIDKVESEWLELVEEDVKSTLAGTFLTHAPLCRVSAATGQGIAELRRILADVAGTLPARDSMAPFRLWIDRAFTVKGYGVVVTGSVLSGTAKLGDNLILYPSAKPVRIRGLETHGTKAEKVMAGQRAAINITGADLNEVSRGMALADANRGQISSDWDVIVDWYDEVASGTRIRLHCGTGEYLGRIYSFKDSDNKYMRLLLESPLYTGAGDRGIVRLYSPQHLVGGVMMIAPSINSRKLSHERAKLGDALYTNNLSEAVLNILLENRQPLEKQQLLETLGFIKASSVDDALAKLLSESKLKKMGDYYITVRELAAMTSGVKSLLTAYHEKFPERAGLSREIIKQRLCVTDGRAFDILAGYWAKTNLLASDGADWALKFHAEEHGDWLQELVAKTETAFNDVGLSDIDEAMLIKKLKLPDGKVRAVRDAFVRQGLLVKVGDMHVYSKTIQYIISLVKQHLSQKSTITVGELRDMLNTSRRVALPLMEYLDMHKYTTRDGDLRRPTQRLLDFSE